MLAALTFLNGCSTKALWEENHFGHDHEPATPANVALFRKEGRPFVVYDERREGSNKIRRRGYWVDPDAPVIPNPHRPGFVLATTTNALTVVPIGTIPEPAGWSAVVLPDAHDFSVYVDGVRRGNYDLPVYIDAQGRIVQVVFTPFAVLVDITIGALVVGAIGAYAMAAGGGH